MKKLITTVMALMLAAGSSYAYVKAGTVTLTKGGVDVVKDRAVMGKIARQGTDLVLDDILRTKRKSYAEVSFADGTLVKIFEKSRLVFTGTDRTKTGYNAAMQKGKVLFKVEKMYDVAGDFRIKTTNAIIGVKGTNLAIAVSPAGTFVEAYSGLVSVQSAVPQRMGIRPAAPVNLTPGHGAVVSENGSVTTYSFGGGAGQSLLFPGAGAGTGSSEAQIFSSTGSEEAGEAGDSGADSGTETPAVSAAEATAAVLSSSAPSVQTALSGIVAAQTAASDIYNSANRPATAQQVEQTVGKVHINIDFQ